MNKSFDSNNKRVMKLLSDNITAIGFTLSNNNFITHLFFESNDLFI